MESQVIPLLSSSMALWFMSLIQAFLFQFHWLCPVLVCLAFWCTVPFLSVVLFWPASARSGVAAGGHHFKQIIMIVITLYLKGYILSEACSDRPT